jgi:hypothetical protein
MLSRHARRNKAKVPWRALALRPPSRALPSFLPPLTGIPMRAPIPSPPVWLRWGGTSAQATSRGQAWQCAQRVQESRLPCLSHGDRPRLGPRPCDRPALSHAHARHWWHSHRRGPMGAHGRATSTRLAPAVICSDQRHRAHLPERHDRSSRYCSASVHMPPTGIPAWCAYIVRWPYLSAHIPWQCCSRRPGCRARTHSIWPTVARIRRGSSCASCISPASSVHMCSMPPTSPRRGAFCLSSTPP